MSVRRTAAVVAVAVALAGAACSSSDSNAGGGSTTAAPGTTAGSTTGSTPGGTTPGTVVGADEACVTDIDAVISAETAPDLATTPLPDDLVAELDAAARASFEEAATPGAIVGVQTPAGTWTAAYGLADPDQGTAMAVGMHTRIGSVTKTFTGTVILQLADQGKLSIDDTIGTYVDGIPNGDEITLRQLLDMTSGVASYTANTGFTDQYFGDPQTIFTPEQLVAAGVADSPLFAPGEQFNYSNTNTILLGLVAEEVTGQPVETLFEQQILEPLGLARTSFPGDSPELPEPYAQGFTLQGDTATPDDPANATNWNPSWTWTAGEVISTVDDLLVYGRHLGTGQDLLDPETQAERLTFPGPAGYGLAIGCIGGWVGHTGELPGYNTTLYYDTTSGTVITVQANSDIASGDCPVSPTVTDDPRTAVCESPATRMFVALSAVTGNEFRPNPTR